MTARLKAVDAAPVPWQVVGIVTAVIVGLLLWLLGVSGLLSALIGVIAGGVRAGIADRSQRRKRAGPARP